MAENRGSDGGVTGVEAKPLSEVEESCYRDWVEKGRAFCPGEAAEIFATLDAIRAQLAQAQRERDEALEALREANAQKPLWDRIDKLAHGVLDTQDKIVAAQLSASQERERETRRKLELLLHDYRGEHMPFLTSLLHRLACIVEEAPAPAPPATEQAPPRSRPQHVIDGAIRIVRESARGDDGAFGDSAREVCDELERLRQAPPPLGLQGHDAPCWYCKQPCNCLAGNPGHWPVALCLDEMRPGVTTWCHTSCVMDRLQAPPPSAGHVYATSTIDASNARQGAEFAPTVPPTAGQGMTAEEWRLVFARLERSVQLELVEQRILDKLRALASTRSASPEPAPEPTSAEDK